MEIEIIGYNDIEEYRKRNIKRGDNVLIIKYSSEFKEDVLKFDDFCFQKNEKEKQTTGNNFKIKISLDADSQRSIKSNALMWKIYEIQSEALNIEAGLLENSERYTKEKLYDYDMNQYAKSYSIIVPSDMREEIVLIAKIGTNKKLCGKLIEEIYSEDKTRVRLTFLKTSSYWSQSEMCTFLTHKLNELDSFTLNHKLNSQAKILIAEFKEYLKSA